MRHGYWGPSFDDGAIESALTLTKIKHTKVSDAAAAPQRSFSPAGRFLVGFRDEWSSAHARSAHAPSWPIARSGDEREGEQRVKFREWWRRLRVVQKRAARLPGIAYDSPFMILTAQVRPEKRA